MSGNHHPDDRYASFSPIDRVILIFLGIVMALTISFGCVAMLEATLKRIDRQNQEQLTWSCVDQSNMDSCVPLA